MERSNLTLGSREGFGVKQKKALHKTDTFLYYVFIDIEVGITDNLTDTLTLSVHVQI